MSRLAVDYVASKIRLFIPPATHPLTTVKEAVEEVAQEIVSYLFRGGKSPRPKVVCLCGSTRFRTAFERAAEDETMRGRIVLTVNVFGNNDGNPVKTGLRFVSEDDKVMLDDLHKRKIDQADEVLVINVNGYIGESTRSEIEYAHSLGLPIRYLEDPIERLLAGS